MPNSPLGGPQNVPASTPVKNDISTSATPTPDVETTGSTNTHDVKAIKADESLLLKGQQDKTLSPSQEAKSITERNVNNNADASDIPAPPPPPPLPPIGGIAKKSPDATNIAGQQNADNNAASSNIPVAPPPPPLPSQQSTSQKETTPPPPSLPTTEETVKNLADGNDTVPAGANPIPKPPRQPASTDDNTLGYVADSEETESSEPLPDPLSEDIPLSEGINVESSRKAPGKLTRTAKKLAHIFGKIKRFLQGTNFEKFPSETLKELKVTAELLEGNKNSENVYPVFTGIHLLLTEWNDNVDKLAELKAEKGADLAERQKLIEKMKSQKKAVADLATSVETILGMQNDIKRWMRLLGVGQQNIAAPALKDVAKQAEKAITSMGTGSPKPSSLADAVKNPRLRKTEQEATDQTVESSEPKPLTMNDEIKNFQFKNRNVQTRQNPADEAEKSSGGLNLSNDILLKAREKLKQKTKPDTSAEKTEAPDDEPEFLKKRREIQKRNPDNSE